MTTEKFKEMQAEMSNEELIKRVQEEVSKMCKTGARSFKMTIPPRITDTDIIICELLRRFEEKVAITVGDLKLSTRLFMVLRHSSLILGFADNRIGFVNRMKVRELNNKISVTEFRKLRNVGAGLEKELREVFSQYNIGLLD